VVHRHSIKIDLFVLILALSLGTALRLYHLGDKGFWGDEIWTAQAAEHDLGYILTHSGAVPGYWRPPMYLVMAHLALFVSPKEFAIRLPAMIFGMLGIAMIYRLGRLFYNRIVGLLAALLLVISPYHLWYSQEARWYSQLAFFSMVSLFFFYRFTLLEDCTKDSIKNGFGFVAGTVLTLYTHLLAFLAIPAQILFAGYVWLIRLLTGKRRPNRFGHSLFILSFGFTIIVILLLTLPLLLPVLSPASTPPPTTPELKITAQLSLQWPDYTSMANLIGSLLAAYGVGNPITVYLFGGLFLLGFFFTVRRQPDLAILTSLWLIGPFLSSIFWQSKFAVLPRYLIFLFPVYLIVVARGITVIAEWPYWLWAGLRKIGYYSSEGHHLVTSNSWRSQRAAIGIGLASVMVIGVLQLPTLRLNYSQGKQTDWRGLAHYLEQHVRPGDVIVGEAWSQAALAYYFSRPGDVSIISVPTSDEARPILADFVKEQRRVWYILIPHWVLGDESDAGGGFNSEIASVRAAEAAYIDHSASAGFISDNFDSVDRREWEDPNFVFPEDGSLAFAISEPVARFYFRDGSTPAQVEFTEIRNVEWTTQSYRSISPGVLTRLYLQLSANRPRSLELTYFDFPGKNFQILVDNQMVGRITSSGSATWKTCQAVVPPSAGDEILVSMMATGTGSVGISKIRLDYVPAEIKFDDIIDAGWTTESYKEITHNESYQGWLALDTSRPRQLKVTYFDFPGKNLRVLADGQVAGDITGSTSATWKTYAFTIPSTSKEVVLFTLENRGTESFGVSKISLEYADQE
jgi:mannosyltransferase